MTHNPAPWTNELTPLIEAGNPVVKLNGAPCSVDLRVLSEDNFQYAKHRVNCHDELLEALIEIEQMVHANEMNEGTMEVVRAAISKAKGESC